METPYVTEESSSDLQNLFASMPSEIFREMIMNTLITNDARLFSLRKDVIVEASGPRYSYRIVLEK